MTKKKFKLDPDVDTAVLPMGAPPNMIPNHLIETDLLKYILRTRHKMHLYDVINNILKYQSKVDNFTEEEILSLIIKIEWLQFFILYGTIIGTTITIGSLFYYYLPYKKIKSILYDILPEPNFAYYSELKLLEETEINGSLHIVLKHLFKQRTADNNQPLWFQLIRHYGTSQAFYDKLEPIVRWCLLKDLQYKYNSGVQLQEQLDLHYTLLEDLFRLISMKKDKAAFIKKFTTTLDVCQPQNPEIIEAVVRGDYFFTRTNGFNMKLFEDPFLLFPFHIQIQNGSFFMVGLTEIKTSMVDETRYYDQVQVLYSTNVSLTTLLVNILNTKFVKLDAKIEQSIQNMLGGNHSEEWSIDPHNINIMIKMIFAVLQFIQK